MHRKICIFYQLLAVVAEMGHVLLKKLSDTILSTQTQPIIICFSLLKITEVIRVNGTLGFQSYSHSYLALTIWAAGYNDTPMFIRYHYALLHIQGKYTL